MEIPIKNQANPRFLSFLLKFRKGMNPKQWQWLWVILIPIGIQRRKILTREKKEKLRELITSTNIAKPFMAVSLNSRTPGLGRFR
ncbi:hypothetical protein V6Z11_A01G151100 [Gossypium hirsutum]